jgi:ParB-like chromosome segregation protein Spo0J
MKTYEIDVDDVICGERHRSLNPETIRSLAESMKVIGLNQPISVWFDDGDYPHLIAGFHRLEAAKSLGWDEIDVIGVDLSPIDRELWEIDENLFRADLTPAEEAQHLARRKELWEKREKTQVGQVVPPEIGNKKPPPQEKGFAADTAKATGESKRDVNRKTSRAEKIAPDVINDIKGTDLDKGTNLDILKKLKPDEQRDAVERVQKGTSPTIDDAYEFITGDPPSKPKEESREQWLTKMKNNAVWKRGKQEWQAEFASRYV